MVNREDKLLERAKSSPANWKRKDLDRLYEAYGFIIENGSKHDIVKNTKYPELRATLPRHNSVLKFYVQYAVKLIEEMLSKDGDKNGPTN